MASVVSRKDVSSVEAYGFVVYVLCYLIGLLYIVWALVPDDVLHSMDITYYPPKSLALYIPTLILGIFLTIPFFYAVLNSRSAPNFDSLDTLWDGYAKTAPTLEDTDLAREPAAACFPTAETTANIIKVPDIYDIDVSIINLLVYSNRNRR